MYIYVLFLDLLPPNKIHSQNSSTRGFFSCVVLSSFPLLNVWKILKKAPPTHALFAYHCPSQKPLILPYSLLTSHWSLGSSPSPIPQGFTTCSLHIRLHITILTRIRHIPAPLHPLGTPQHHFLFLYSLEINTSDSARLSCSQLLFVWSVSPLLLYVWLCMSASLGELVASSQSHGELHYHCTALHLKLPPLCPASYSFAQPAMEELTFFFCDRSEASGWRGFTNNNAVVLLPAASMDKHPLFCSPYLNKPLSGPLQTRVLMARSCCF